jgi:hypothetical protein
MCHVTKRFTPTLQVRLSVIRNDPFVSEHSLIIYIVITSAV